MQQERGILQNITSLGREWRITYGSSSKERDCKRFIINKQQVTIPTNPTALDVENFERNELRGNELIITIDDDKSVTHVFIAGAGLSPA